MKKSEQRELIQRLGDLQGFLENIKARSTGGEPVNHITCRRVPAVAGCIKVIRDDLGGVPFKIYRKYKGRTEPVTDHPAYEKIKLRPNPEMKAFDWQKKRIPDQIVKGNSYSFIERSIANPVKNMWPLDPEEVNIVRVKTRSNRRGLIYYDVMDGYTRKRYKPGDILHVKGATLDGIAGYSELLVDGREFVSVGLELIKFERRFFQQGFFPNGFFKVPGKLADSDTWLEIIKKKFGGNRNNNTPMTLENGMDFVKNEIKLLDNQFRELQEQNKTDICGLLGVPLSRLSVSGSNTNYNNSEQEKERYYQSGLLPWAVADEQEISLKLLTSDERKKGLYAKYNFSAFLRADSKTRAEVHRTYHQMGVPLNTIMDLEDRNPVEGGDKGYIQVNMMPLKEADKPQEARTMPERRSSSEAIVKARDRVRNRFEPTIREAFDRIVNKETKAVIRAAGKEDYRERIADFYKKFAKDIDENLRSVFTSFAFSCEDVVAGEVEAEPGQTEDLDETITTYVTGAVDQYIGESIVGLKEKDPDEIVSQAERWRENRADGATHEHTTGVANMVAWCVILGAGYRLKWYTRGKSCPICNSLHGRTVSKKGESFNSSGEEFEDKDGNKVTFRQTKYAPLHKGCDCFVAAG